MPEEQDFTFEFSMSGKITVSAESLAEAREIVETLLEEAPDRDNATIKCEVSDVTVTQLEEKVVDGREITDIILTAGDRLPYCRYHQAQMTEGGISFTVVEQDTSTACVVCLDQMLQEEENEHGE